MIVLQHQESKRIKTIAENGAITMYPPAASLGAGRDLARATPSEPIYKRLQSERDLTRMRQMGLLRR